MTREAEKVRQQRALDMCGLLLFIETKEERIICSEHGVQYSAVPWAYGGSRFTKDFDRTAAWLAFHLFSKAVEEYFRIDWETEAERIYSSNMTLAVSSSDSAFPGSPHMKSCLQGMPSIESPLSINSERIIGFMHYFISFFFLSFLF